MQHATIQELKVPKFSFQPAYISYVLEKGKGKEEKAKAQKDLITNVNAQKGICLNW